MNNTQIEIPHVNRVRYLNSGRDVALPACESAWALPSGLDDAEALFALAELEAEKAVCSIHRMVMLVRAARYLQSINRRAVNPVAGSR